MKCTGFSNRTLMCDANVLRVEDVACNSLGILLLEPLLLLLLLLE